MERVPRHCRLYTLAPHLLSKSQFLFIVRHKPWHFYYANITRWRTRVTTYSRAWLEEWKRGHSETSAFKPFFQLKLSRPKRQCQPNFFNISRFIAARHISRIVALCSGTLFWFLILKRRLFTHQRAPNEELRLEGTTNAFSVMNGSWSCASFRPKAMLFRMKLFFFTIRNLLDQASDGREAIAKRNFRNHRFERNLAEKNWYNNDRNRRLPDMQVITMSIADCA